MKVFNKKKVLFNLIVAGLSVMLMQGISASADTDGIVTGEAEVEEFPTQSVAVDIYTPKKLTLTTVGVSDLDMVSNEGKSLKELLVDSLTNCESVVDVSSFSIPVADLWKITSILGEIKMEHPELFNMTGSYAYSYSERTMTFVQLQLGYNVSSLAEYQAQLKVVDDKFAEVIDTITDDMSDLEKALIVHDYLCDNFAYDLTYSKHDMYSFVTTGDGVCQAYMYSYAYILGKLGIESYPVMNNEIKHTWNMVKLDGKYYQVDVTWDDFTPDLYGWAGHDYFLLSDEDMSQTKHGSKSVDDSNTSGWFLYEDISATDNTYNAYDFRDTSLPYVLVNGQLYNINHKDGTLYKYNVDTNTTTNITSITADDTWCVWGGSIINEYSDKYSSLHAYKDVLVFNKLNSICVMDTNGNILDIPYSRQSSDSAIFGITVRDGVVYAQIEQNLNTERDDFGTNIVPTFSIADWYETHKDALQTTTEATTTTAETTTTTEETTTTTEVTTTTPEETTTTVETTTTTEIERVPCVELEEPDFETLYGYVYPAFSNGIAKQWTPNGLSKDDTYPIIAQPVAITGNGDYTLTINIPEGYGSSVIEFLGMDSTLNSYQQNYLQQNILDEMTWDITSIVIDGVEVAYTPSENSLIMGNDGSSYRKLIYDNWTGKNVKDIDPEVANTKSIVINFTISGIKPTVEETTTPEVTTTPEETTTTTEPVTTTAPAEVTTTEVANTVVNTEKIDNVKVEVSKEIDADTGKEVSVATAVLTTQSEDESLPEDIQIKLDGQVLSSNFFSYDKDTGKITFNTDAIAEAFGEDVDLETIFNSMEVYSVTTSSVEDKFDLNGDGNVGADDLLSFKVVYNNIIRGKVSYDDVEQYDLNGDGTINILDMLEIKRQILGTSKNK
jgi:hypothetical protein